MDGRRTRVLIVDPLPLFREGVAAICDREADLEVVGQAGGGADAMALAARETPDVVLIDVAIPGLEVEETLRGIAGVSPRPKVAVFSVHDDARTIHMLLAAGAEAYISKGATRAELIAAIRAMRLNGDHVVLSVPKRAMGELAKPAEGPLSVREREVIDLVADGLSNAEIAAQLYVSEGTVKRHLTNIYIKLDVRSRMNAINRASKLGLLGGGRGRTAV